jgi:probable F420-dependent oxidoreductase
MQLGAIFPQTEIGTDPIAIRDYAQAVEEMGFSHLVAFDHVLGANIKRPDRQGRQWPYTSESPFHEPFVLYGYLAGLTSRIGLVTGVLISTQRQTALVAKQAAAVDVLSRGRLRLGIGIGWNEVEYQALGENFRNRGARTEEQIVVLRKLWTEPLITFHGQWHHIPDAGINPLPVQRPIPLWLGGRAEPVLRRIGELADGWILVGPAGPETVEQWDRVREYAQKAGRDPATIGLEGGIRLKDGGPDQWQRDWAAWRRLGADYVAVNTMGAGFHLPAEHVEALRRVKHELGV